jgi:hypothetical protein
VTNKLPSDPNDRRIIVVLDKSHIDDGRIQTLDKPTVALVRWPVSREDPLAVMLDSARLLNPGAVLLQNPYEPDSYEEISKAETEFQRSKNRKFGELCGLLGAIECSVESMRAVRESEATDGRLEFQYLFDTAEIKGGDQKSKDFAERFRLHLKWNGGEPNFSEVDQMLCKTGLANDPDMLALVSMRKRSNSFISQTLEIEVSQETKRTLSFAADLSIPECLTTASAFMRKRVSSNLSLFLRMHVAFPAKR